jgi:hypothetical protein
MNKVSIYGGLGNQMFQYALYVSLKEDKLKTGLSLSEFLHEYHHNGFNLGEAFHLHLPFPESIICSFLLNGKIVYKNRIGRAFFRRSLEFYKEKLLKIYKEKAEFVYDHALFQQKSSLLIGTWQVEDYFKKNKALLLKEFDFRIPADEKNKALIKILNATNSISIHVRRGDYLSSEYFKSHTVIKDATYYKNAINYLEKNIEDPHYFIFSDDIEWVRQNLYLQNSTVVDYNTGNKSYIDMYLMSLCKHNIIANSTFSWWGAWLNRNEKKIVIMPDKWLNHVQAPGIFPPEWIKLSV